MPSLPFIRSAYFGGLLIAIAVCLMSPLPAAEPVWKAGIARAVITPTESMWLAGYGSRTKPSEGKLHDLWIRVLAVEDAGGHRGIVLSSDTLGISKPIYDEVVQRLGQSHGLTRAQIMLHASHTHCGPVLKSALYDIYPLDAEQIAKIEKYSAWLTDTIVDTVSAAIKDLQPATLVRGQGSAGFAVNRRNNREPDVPRLREQGKLLGPVDHSVPVLAVKKPDGSLKAVVFMYACHNTTLSFDQFCGDYAGFAQYALEDRHPGATAMFVLGCGADQNPLPRRTVELCQQYGIQLADAVDAVLKNPLQPVSPKLQTEIELADLALGALPEKSKMEAMAAAAPNYSQRWAARILKEQAAGATLPTSYPYPIQAWRLGGEQLWIALGGEVVVDYSLKFKGRYGEGAWVTGYANDVMAYIPSHRVLLEGGYEGQSSMMVYGLPAERWGADVEDRVTAGVERVVSRLGTK
ncbi:MAG TPA: neutral/alkaline non-lysosomal ceramidase N-terminal domain-containing protein [Planctomycetaceae bacterium]|nr:neutral/alkaline non-lysosomal ceramidase N-terminal domain-containing protein [Planctomycetaceae bacterium]